MNYKLLTAIFVALVVLSIGSIVYAATENTITESESADDATVSPVYEEQAASDTTLPDLDSLDYTEYFLAIIDMMNLICACLIAAIVIIVLTIVSMRWI